MNRKWSLAASVMVVAFLIGCGKPGSDSTDSGGATDTVAGNPTVTPDNDGFPGDGKTDEWRRYVGRLDFNLEFADLDSTAVMTYTCKAGDACPNGVVRFLVVPEKHGYGTDWNDVINSPNKKGLVLASYWNMDTVRVNSLNLPAHARLYQWVGPVSATARGIQVFSVTDSTGVRVVAEGGPSDFKFCKLDGRRDKAAAKKDPGHACAAVDDKKTQTKAMMMMSFERFMGDDLWLSCAGGCCQSSLTSVQ